MAKPKATAIALTAPFVPNFQAWRVLRLKKILFLLLSADPVVSGGVASTGDR